MVLTLQKHQLCVPPLPFSSHPRLVPFLILGLKTNHKLCQELETGMDRNSEVISILFHMGHLREQGTLSMVESNFNWGFLDWEHNLFTGKFQKQCLWNGFACAFSVLRNFPLGGTQLRISGCCHARLRCGQHSGGLKYVGVSPNGTDRFLPTLDK